MAQAEKKSPFTVKQLELPWVYDLYLLGHKAALGEGSEAQRELLDHIVQAFDADSGSLAVLNNADENELKIIAGIDLPEHVIGQTVSLGYGVMGWVAEQGEPLLLNGDIASDPRFSMHRAPREKKAPSSALCWPLRVDDQTVGVININRGAERSPFTEQDLVYGVSIIRFVAIAVENARLHRRSTGYVQELRDLVSQLEEAQTHLMQSEKMASIGQLAAGVAHEINNPIGYISSNLNTLQSYVDDLLQLLGLYESASPLIQGTPEISKPIEEARDRVDISYLKEDLRSLMEESQEGVSRVRQIVQDLKEFSHVDQAEWQWADLHAGLDTTLNIVNNELKYRADVVKHYGDLPMIECMPTQLNQVFMNILVNAAHALEDRGTITIRSGMDGADWVWVEISDTGKGIPQECLARLFEPFFTTKPVGQGTGLGLALSYGIVEKHGGRIDVSSTVGEGSSFLIRLPVSQSSEEADGEQ